MLIKNETKTRMFKSNVINLDVEQKLSLKFVLPLLKEYAEKVKEKVIICEECKIPFVTSTNYKKNICLKCNRLKRRRDNKKTSETKKCLNCGNLFVAQNKSQRFCKSKCRSEYKIKNEKHYGYGRAICLACKKEFPKKYVYQKFCSANCVLAHKKK